MPSIEQSAISRSPDAGGSPRATSAAADAVVVLVSSIGLGLLAYTYALGRSGDQNQALYWVSQVVLVSPFLVFAAFARGVSARRYTALVAAFGASTYLVRYMYSPNRVRFWDELSHWRGIENVVADGRLGATNYSLSLLDHFFGFQSAAVVFRTVAGLTSDQAGLMVAGLSHVALVSLLFALFRRLGLTSRWAFVAVLAYAANGGFIGLSQMAVYQTLALPMCVAVLWLARAPLEGNLRPARIVGGVLIALCIITHHLTAIFLLLALLLYVLDDVRLDKPRLRRLSGPFLLGAAAFETLWFALDAGEVGRYVRPFTTRLLDIPVVGSDPVTSSGPVREANLPLFDYLAQRAGVLVIGFCFLWWLVSFVRERDFRTSERWAEPSLTLAFLLSVLVSRLGGAVGELANRLAPFLFVGVAVVVTVALRRLVSGFSPKAVRPLLAALLLTTYLGGVATSFPQFWGRIPGPYLVYGFDRGVDIQSVRAGEWVQDNFEPGTPFFADGNGTYVLETIGNVEANFTGFRLFFLANNTLNVRRLLDDTGIEYVWVDRRIVTAPTPYGRIFSGREARVSEGRPTELDIDTLIDLPGARTVYDDGTIAILDMKGVRS